MKKLLLIIAMGAFTVGMAQENKVEETKTTKTTVKDNSGETVMTKKEVKSQKQNIELEGTETNKTNFNTTMSPAIVNTSVSYSSNDYKYTLTPNKSGYDMMRMGTGDIKTSYARLRPTSQKGYYLMSNDTMTSFVYFNEMGDIVVENYDPKTDAINTTIYEVVK